MSNHYTFGDNDDAADRLVLLARAFEPSTARFLERLREGAEGAAPTGVEPSQPRTVDLGCGPGFTTALLHSALGARETWGLDASDRLAERARARFGGPEAIARYGTGLRFAVHDVTAAPYPVGEIDLFYARYLFTHIPSPRAVFEACAAAATPGARFAIEDNCSLESSDPLFGGYYERVRLMHAHYGQDMWVGERLPLLVRETPWTVERFDRTPIRLDAGVMGRLHAMNVRTWRNDAFARSSFDAAEIDAMAAALEDVAAGKRAAPEVICTMGQAILRLADQRPSR